MTLGRRFHCNLALRVVEAGNLFRISGLVLRASGQGAAFWLCLGLFSPSVQFDFFLISPCNNSVYTHLTFLQIGFVLHKTLWRLAFFCLKIPIIPVSHASVFRLLTSVSCLLSPVFCPLSSIICLSDYAGEAVLCPLSSAFCSLFSVSCLLTSDFCLPSPVSCILCPISILIHYLRTYYTQKSLRRQTEFHFNH
jgi:hypothetical protein